jgi:protein gp37
VSDKSAIEWTDATWNPTTGCTRVSEGCRHCYIDRTPLFRIGVPKPRNDGAPIPPRRFDSAEIGGKTGVMLHPERLDQPLRWKRPRRIFVNSLSDLFHDDVPTHFIQDVFATMGLASQHVFQVLTKRPRRMMEFCKTFDIDYWREDYGLTEWPLPNVWLGTSVEDQKAADLRIPLLLDTPAAVRFLSCEPLLGPVDLARFLHYPDCQCLGCFNVRRGTVPEMSIHWVIAGGESGPGARPMHPDWARSLRDQCEAASVPFFFKQWGEWWPVPDDRWDLRRMDASILCDNGYVYPLTEPHEVPGENGKAIRKVGKKKAGRELDGRAWDEMPERVL